LNMPLLSKETVSRALISTPLAFPCPLVLEDNELPRIKASDPVVILIPPALPTPVGLTALNMPLPSKETVSRALIFTLPAFPWALST
jgi:hypothetical protein